MKAKSLLLLCSGFLLTAFCCLAVSAIIPAKITVSKTNYQGWQDSYILSNGQVEAVVVPKVGRIMEFRFKNGENTFWENTQVYGKAPNIKSEEWGYFGAGGLDPKAYIELEFLSPIKTLRVGEKISLKTTYTLIPRTTANPDQEAMKILGR